MGTGELRVTGMRETGSEIVHACRISLDRVRSWCLLVTGREMAWRGKVQVRDGESKFFQLLQRGGRQVSGMGKTCGCEVVERPSVLRRGLFSEVERGSLVGS